MEVYLDTLLKLIFSIFFALLLFGFIAPNYFFGNSRTFSGSLLDCCPSFGSTSYFKLFRLRVFSFGPYSFATYCASNWLWVGVNYQFLIYIVIPVNVSILVAEKFEVFCIMYFVPPPSRVLFSNVLLSTL